MTCQTTPGKDSDKARREIETLASREGGVSHSRVEAKKAKEGKHAFHLNFPGETAEKAEGCVREVRHHTL